nr:hypothetical protein B0A51_04499 [Rachicladosporium sp. CCFEE 5018]
MEASRYVRLPMTVRLKTAVPKARTPCEAFTVTVALGAALVAALLAELGNEALFAVLAVLRMTCVDCAAGVTMLDGLLDELDVEVVVEDGLDPSPMALDPVEVTALVNLAVHVLSTVTVSDGRALKQSKFEKELEIT